MFRKYIDHYLNSISLAVTYPKNILFFLFLNLSFLLNLMNINEGESIFLYTLLLVLRIGAMGGIGYVTIRIIRSNKEPEKVFSRGVVKYFFPMVKLIILQMVVYLLTGFLPITLLSRVIVIPPIALKIWEWGTDFVFMFLIYEAIFWADKGVLKAFRMRNVYMLDRFEWLLLVYIIVNLPQFLVMYLRLWGFNWLTVGAGPIIVFLIVSFLGWINTIFTFRIYGEDRIQVVQEMEKRVREAELNGKDWLRKRKNKK